MKKDVLYVRMLGGFSAEWNGEPLTEKLGLPGSQFRRLMQVLLHRGAAGASRALLEEVLFEGRELNNTHHALQSVVYNSEKKLEALGLPETDFIKAREKTFYWTSGIPVEEDAAEFEALAHRAMETEEPAEKLRCLLQAAELYQGEFLPELSGILWAAEESRRLRALFCRCMEAAVPLLRERRDFARMEKLGRQAAAADPLADWETVTMEALTAMGKLEEAQRLYDETADLYLRELGVQPSDGLLGPLEKLAEGMRHSYAPLSVIQSYISRERSEPGAGGYLCPYPVFRGIYHFVSRMMERGGQAAYLMLCTVVDGAGMPLNDEEALDVLAPRMESAIRQSVRQSDTVSRYGRGQYLVLLLNTTREDCAIIQQRISQRFRGGGSQAQIEYAVNTVDVL